MRDSKARHARDIGCYDDDLDFIRLNGKSTCLSFCIYHVDCLSYDVFRVLLSNDRIELDFKNTMKQSLSYYKPEDMKDFMEDVATQSNERRSVAREK